MLGVRHQADNVAALVGDTGDVASTAVGIDVQIPRDDTAVSFEPIEGVLVCNVTALTVFKGMTISWPGVKSRVQSEAVFSIRSFWSRHTKCK